MPTEAWHATKRLRTSLTLWIAMLAAIAGCGPPTSVSSPSDERVLPAGTWGGEGIVLTVTATGAHVELDCAHGEITDVPKVGSDGVLNLRGVFEREQFVQGPPVSGAIPAHYVGHLVGKVLTMTIMLPAPTDELGPFVATLGAAAEVRKCG
jgi:hypothetical protein